MTTRAKMSLGMAIAMIPLFLWWKQARQEACAEILEAQHKAEVILQVEADAGGRFRSPGARKLAEAAHGWMNDRDTQRQVKACRED